MPRNVPDNLVEFEQAEAQPRTREGSFVELVRLIGQAPCTSQDTVKSRIAR
ncbi:MAG: hypothetical protein RLZ84_36 [Actinomycetota bacterium]